MNDQSEDSPLLSVQREPAQTDTERIGTRLSRAAAVMRGEKVPFRPCESCSVLMHCQHANQCLAECTPEAVDAARAVQPQRDENLVKLAAKGLLETRLVMLCPVALGTSVTDYEGVGAVELDWPCTCGASHRFSANDAEIVFSHPARAVEARTREALEAENVMVRIERDAWQRQYEDLLNRAAGHVCASCFGAYRFDTSLPSPTWNAVIRAHGLPEFLCAACIVRAFAKAGEGFTATLWGDGFSGTEVEFVIGGEVARDAELLSHENTELRHQAHVKDAEIATLKAEARPPAPVSAEKKEDR